MSDTDQPLSIDQADRFDSLRLIPWWDQTRLAQARVLVVGAGALGNEAIKNLALLGVGHIGIVDMDRVEASNLSRSILYRRADEGRLKSDVAAERVRDIDPQIDAVSLPHNVMEGVGLGWFADADCVLGCLDNREARLWVNRCCWHVGTPWIDAGIQEISGVVQVFQPPDGSCYECGMKAADYRLINLRYSCPLLRQEDIHKGRVPTTPTIASIIAGWQVQEALKLLHGLPTDASSALIFHGTTNHVYRTRLPHREDCLSHDPWPPPFPLVGLTRESTVSQFLANVRQSHPGQAPRAIRLMRDLLVGLSCGPCESNQQLCRIRSSTPAALAQCPDCGNTMAVEIRGRIDADEMRYSEHSLGEIGMAAADIVAVEFDEAVATYRLSEPTFNSSPTADSHETP